MGAIFSPCGTWRYGLWRDLSGDGPIVAWSLHNPSTAGESVEDPTSRRGIGFSTAWGARKMWFTNPFAGVATKKADLWNMADPIGPDNMKHTAAIAKECAESGGWFVMASGVVSPPKRLQSFAMDQMRAVSALIASVGCPVKCLGRTDAGWPRHPLYLPANTPLEDW